MRSSIGAALAIGLALANTPTVASAKTWTVNPGSSIQTAVDGAAAGDTINVMPGDYTEPIATATSGAETAAVRITKSLKLIAKSKLPGTKVRVLAGAGQDHGIIVEPANGTGPDIVNLTIQGFTIEGFPNMGIYLRHVQKFTIQGNESINNQENGIFPTLSANGLVKKNLAYGALDSAMWIEGSQNVRVVDNELAKSPTGLEVTISKDITIEHNNVHDNTIGIGLYHPQTAGLPLADRPAAPYGPLHVKNNHVHHNNFPNTAPGGSETSNLPYGGGILLLGVQDVDVQKNVIERNDFFGIAAVDYCLVVLGTAFDCSSQSPAPSTLAPTYPDNDKIFKNKLVDNHAFVPAGPYATFAADILELGGTAANCFSKNKIINSSALAAPQATYDPDPPTECP